MTDILNSGLSKVSHNFTFIFQLNTVVSLYRFGRRFSSIHRNRKDVWKAKPVIVVVALLTAAAAKAPLLTKRSAGDAEHQL